jgi:hypothetical protein
MKTMDPVKRLEKARRDAEMRTRKFYAEERRVRREVWENFSSSFMNNTKWAETIETMNRLGLQCRLKFIDVDEPTYWTQIHSPAWGWMEGPYVPWRSAEVEWMEINPVGLLPCETMDRSAELESALTDFNIPFTREGPLFRVTGHVRKSGR